MNYEREFTSEFVINSLPSNQRELLLLKDTRNSICDIADVSISVRGRYVKPRSDGTLICDGNVKPLYLLISSKSKHNLSRAMEKIQQILTNSNSSPHNKSNGVTDDDSLEEKITIGIDLWPTQFRMRSRILGENEEFVKYIEKETGAFITLQGRGSSYANNNKVEEPLHIHIKYKNPQMKKRTRELVLNLIETVQKDFLESYARYYSHPKKPEIIPIRDVRKQIAPNKKDGGKLLPRNDTDKIMVGFDYAPRNFDLKGKIYGPNYSHIEHIEKEGGAILLLQGRGCRFPDKDDVDEPPHLLVKYKKPELKSHARDLIFHLLETLHQEFVSLHGTYPIKPQKPRIVPYNPRAPNGKRKSRESSLSPRRNLIYSRRENTPPPKSSRRSTSRLNTRKSRSPVIPPPPPVISKPFSPDSFNSDPADPLSQMIPAFNDSLRGKVIPSLSYSADNFIESRNRDENFKSHPSTMPQQLNKPVQDFKNPQFYMSKVQQQQHQPRLASSFKLQSSFRQQQYIKNRSHSPESAIKNEFPESKKYYSPPFPSSVHSGVEEILSATPISVVVHEPIIRKGKKRSLVNISLRNEFATSQSSLRSELASPENSLRNEVSSPRKFATPHNASKNEFTPSENLLRNEFVPSHNSLRNEFAASQNSSRNEFVTPENSSRKEFSTPENSLRNEFATSQNSSRKEFLTPENSLRNKFAIARNASSRNEFATPQITQRDEFSSSSNVSTVTRNIPSGSRTQFNGYECAVDKTHQFTVSTKTSRTTRRNRKLDSLYAINDDSSNSEDNSSVIYIDSEDDYYRPEKPTAIGLERKPMKCNVKIQTMNEDEVLKNKKMECICGKFTHFLTGVRSRGVQTDPERYCRF